MLDLKNISFYFQPERLISPKLKQFKKSPRIPHSSNLGDAKPDATYHRSETKHSFHSEWIPLDVDPVTEHFKHSHPQSRRRVPKIPTTKLPPIAHTEFPTHHPVIQYEQPAAVYPLTMFSEMPNTFHNLHYLNELNALNNPNMKQNTIDLTHLTVLPVVEHPDAEIIASPKMLQHNEDRLKNHRLSYEVTEHDSNEDGGYVMEADETSDEDDSGKKKHRQRERRNRSRVRENNEKVNRQGRSSPHNRGKTRHH